MSDLVELLRTTWVDVSETECFAAQALGGGDEFLGEGAHVDEPTREWATKKIRASVLRFFCLHPDAQRLVDSRGVRLTCCTIIGKLDLSFASLAFPLRLERCWFNDELNIENARLPHFSLRRSRVPALRATGIVSRSNLDLTGLTVEKTIDLRNAAIRGDCLMEEVEFPEPEPGPETETETENSKQPGRGIFLSGARMDGSVNLTAARVFGSVRMIGARIKGSVGCDRARLWANGQEDALNGDRVDVGGSISLGNRFRARGEVRLFGARVGGSLYCFGRFHNPTGDALSLDRLEVSDNLLISRAFHAVGGVRLLGARVGGMLDCAGRFRQIGLTRADANQTPYAVLARNLIVGNEMRLRNARVRGTITLTGARVAGDLDVLGSVFRASDEKSSAVEAQRLRVKGTMRVQDGSVVYGTVDLRSARIGADLSVNGVDFRGARTGLNGVGMRVERRFAWQAVTHVPDTELILSYAAVGQLDDTPSVWPAPTHLRLDGFTYQMLARPADNDAASSRWSWLRRVSARALDQLRVSPRRADAGRAIRVSTEPRRWLARDGSVPFDPQPYEQLASVLRRTGQDGAARAVGIEREGMRRRRGRVGFWGQCKSLLLATIGYGYAPGRALVWAVVVVGVGAGVFRWGANQELMVPVGQSIETPAQPGHGDTRTALRPHAAIPAFSPVVYALDSFLPIVDLREKGYWIPAVERDCLRGERPAWLPLRCGLALRAYHVVHVLLGWLLTTAAVLAFTGLVRPNR